MSASMCGDVSADGDGAPEQFWNVSRYYQLTLFGIQYNTLNLTACLQCAETRILANNAAQATTAANPTNQPTNPPTAGVQSASVAIPVGSINTSSLANTPKINSSGRSKTIVGYYGEQKDAERQYSFRYAF